MSDVTTKLDLSPYSDELLWTMYFSGIISRAEMAHELRQRDESLN